jgi:hypothetical protein
MFDVFLTDTCTFSPFSHRKELKMIEKLKAKIEYHEIRDENDEANKLWEQIQAIENKQQPAHHVKA